MCTFSLKLLFLITSKASARDCTECLSHMTSGIICPAKRVTVGIERAVVRLFRYSCSEESLSTGGFSTELLFGRCACVQLDLPFLLNKYSVWKHKHRSPYRAWCGPVEWHRPGWGERKESLSIFTLLLICVYSWWNWAPSERWGHNRIWLAFLWWSGSGSRVPADCLVCLRDSARVFPCINTGMGDFTE